ncbi:MAG: DUF4845 domain-containing protein [Gallionella sp.]
MNTAMPARQQGITFSGFIFGAVVLVFLAIMALKLIPAYLQAAEIKDIFETIAHDPDMQKASLHDIKASFDRRASIDAITVIHADDIDISDDNGRPVLSASYGVKIPVAGNVSLYLDFNPSSAGK